MNKELNQDIWNPDKSLKKDIRINLLKLAKDFYDHIDIEKLVLKDIVFVGSLANYTYTNKSDIDIHVVIDYSKLQEEEIIKDLIQSKKTVWNLEHEITVKGFNVEVYPEDFKSKQPSTGKYSLIKDEWIIEPKLEDMEEPDMDLIKKKAKSYKDTIDYFEKQSQKKDVDVDTLIQKIDEFREKLSEMRKEAIKQGGEFSMDNLIFKYLRHMDYLEKIKTLRNNLYDAEFTITEFSYD